MDVAIEDTRAAWLLGIPPVRQIMVSAISRRFLCRDRSTKITAFINWAKNQLETEDKNIGFSRKALSGSALRGMAKDIA
ncbi:hypothetical protein FACS189485_02780 [Spirochaetia bacterium]|nr:hypothetical protein FACS189485_02780 [Spirochaetia bacterium]